MCCFSQINIQFTDAHEKRFETGQKARLARKLSGGGGRRAITYNANCDASEQEKLVKFTADAAYKIAAAKSCTETSCATLVPQVPNVVAWTDIHMQVDTWFGASTTQSEFAAVTAVFNTMATKTQDSIYNCPENDPSGQGCDSSTFAYVYPDDSTQVQSLECHHCC